MPVNSLEQSVIAFDVGGSHISSACCDLNDLGILHSACAPLASDLGCDAFLDLVCRLGCEVSIGQSSVTGAVLAVPGPFDLIAGVSHMRHKLKSLYGVSLRAALARRMHLYPDQVRFLNDAGAFLLGEMTKGAAQGASRAIGIVLGTGIGSAFAHRGGLVAEGEGVPPNGEIWNLPFGKGIVEDLLSTRAIQRDYAARTGRNEEVVSIAANAASDIDARKVFESFGQNLGRVFRDVLSPFAPETIVIGGGISRAASLFLPFAQGHLNGCGFELLTSTLLNEAPLVGAAAFWRHDAASISEAGLRSSGDFGPVTDAP